MKGFLQWIVRGDPLERLENGIERFLRVVVVPALVLLGIALMVAQYILAIGGN